MTTACQAIMNNSKESKLYLPSTSRIKILCVQRQPDFLRETLYKLDPFLLMFPGFNDWDVSGSSHAMVCRTFSGSQRVFDCFGETSRCKDQSGIGLSFIISIVPGTPSNHFNWMIPNCHIGCGCFTKHPF